MWEYIYQNKNCITIVCKNTEFILKWHFFNMLEKWAKYLWKIIFLIIHIY